MKLEEVIEEVIEEIAREDSLLEKYPKEEDITRYFWMTLGRKDAWEQVLYMLRKVGKE